MKNETIDDLQLDGLKLIQKTDNFRFGVDAVLLSDFAKPKKNDRVLDIGTGTGIIPILIAAKTGAAHITGIEIQPEMAEMASRSVKMNELSERINILHGDIRDWESVFSKGEFDLVVANPPYMSVNSAIKSSSDAKAIARHEIKCTLEDLVSAAAGVLKPNGKFALIHKPARLVDILDLFRKNSIEPKLLRFVFSKNDVPPSMVLVHGTKFGKKELRVKENLYIFNQDGSYSDEINRIYNRSGSFGKAGEGIE